MTFIEIQAKIRNTQYLDFGRILDQSINMFKEIWLKGFLMVLIIAACAFCLTILFSFIGMGPNTNEAEWDTGFNLYAFYSNNVWYALLQTIIMSSITIGLLAGFYRICKQVDVNRQESDDLFYFFKGGYIQKIGMLGLIYALIAAIAQSLYVIPYIYAFVPLSFFAIIFANNTELTETEIVKLSFYIGTKKWLITFGLLFITGILGMLGILACGVGILFTMSIVYIPVYFVYRDVIGFEDNDEIMKIGTE